MRTSFAALISTSLSVCLLSGCALFKTHSTPNGGESEVLSKNGIETVVILGTNDIHGGLLPQSLKTREPEGTAGTEYEAGGVAYLASEIKALRSEYGFHLIWLDAGDEFQGSIESNEFQGAPMVQFFNSTGLNAAAIGNHEFDYGAAKGGDPTDKLGALKARMTEAHYPYLAANIADKSTGHLPDFPNTQKSILLTAGNLKVGVIGLSTLDTPTTTRSDNVQSLEFKDLKLATLEEANSLRQQGADLVVITAHAGLRCDKGHAPAAQRIRKITDRQGDCDEGDEMVKLLKSLPAGTVDAVVAGHTHQIVHHWVAGVPVIEGGAFGRYFNLVYLTYDLKHHRLMTDRTRIEGPIPVCPKIFQHQGDCYGDAPAPRGGRGPLITPVLHGFSISPDTQVTDLLAPVVAQTGEIKKKVYGQAARPIEHERMKESPMGNLVADAIREEVHADVALMNAGGIRAPFEQGPITYGEIYRTLPFDNAISVLTVTGKQLKMILRIAENGSRGFFPVSGLVLKVIDPAYDAPSDDLDHDGKVSPWEINRLLEARLSDGSVIRDNAKYKLATIDFLVTGGDGMGWIMGQLTPDQVLLNAGGVMRDALAKKIARSGPLNSVDQPLVMPEAPRLVFVKPKGKSKTGKKGRHHPKKRKAQT